MKKLFKTVLVSLLALGTLAGCSSDSSTSTDRLEQIKERGYIVLGTSPDYAPNEFYIADENGDKQIVGSDIALAQAIADEIGVELKIQESDFNTVILNVQAGTVDMGISGFAWKAERAEVVNFSVDYSRAASDSYQGLMIRKEDEGKWADKDAMKAANIKVGAQNGSIQYNMALTITDEKNIVSLADTTACAALLSTGDIDAFVCTSPQALACMETYDNIMLLPQKDWDMDPDNEYDKTGVIVMKDSSSDSLLEVIDKVITDAKTVGDDGLSLLDVWYNEATDQMPFEIDQSLLANYEDSEDYEAGLTTEE